jgi:hypothetical protein
LAVGSRALEAHAARLMNGMTIFNGNNLFKIPPHFLAAHDTRHIQKYENANSGTAPSVRVANQEERNTRFPH